MEVVPAAIIYDNPFHSHNRSGPETITSGELVDEVQDHSLKADLTGHEPTWQLAFQVRPEFL
jgi:hypothetical protein